MCWEKAYFDEEQSGSSYYPDEWHGSELYNKD